MVSDFPPSPASKPMFFKFPTELKILLSYRICLCTTELASAPVGFTLSSHFNASFLGTLLFLLERLVKSSFRVSARNVILISTTLTTFNHLTAPRGTFKNCAWLYCPIPMAQQLSWHSEKTKQTWLEIPFSRRCSLLTRIYIEAHTEKPAEHANWPQCPIGKYPNHP